MNYTLSLTTNAPNTMLEIGRLREEAYRFSGGGTGKAVDIDTYDTMEGCYKQLIVWNPDKNEIMGGYRYIYGKDVRFNEQGEPLLSSGHLFSYSDMFIEDFLPYTIELGRSFVTVGYQSSIAGSKALFALDNLWDRSGRSDCDVPGHEVLLWQGNHVSQLWRKGTQHDFILPQ